LDASGSTDLEDNIISYAWDLDNDGSFDDGSGITSTINVPQDGEYIVSVKVVDEFGAEDTATTIVYVSNVSPGLGTIAAPQDPVQLGNEIQVSASFSDPGADSWTATWYWGDSTSSGGTIGDFTAYGAHTYEEAGVYTIMLTVSDGTDSDSEVFEYVVVYDPDGGFVTGGGWIQSPEGAYTPDPSLSGKATFGFVSKYKKGADVPTGNTEFHFKTADFHFKSTTYQWLVIAGKQAKFKGEGEINGQSGYGFMISARDGDLQGGDGLDKFRIKIWELGTEVVVYDNQLGDADDADPTTDIGGGSIVIHQDK
jgi:PKD repeat protein